MLYRLWLGYDSSLKGTYQSVTLSPSASNISTASTEEINVDVDALDSTGNDLTLDSITSAVVSGAASDVNISYDANYTGINISCNGTFEGKTFTGTKTIVIKFTFTKDKTSITRNYVINIKAATSSTISSYKVNFGTPIISTDTTKTALCMQPQSLSAAMILTDITLMMQTELQLQQVSQT